ncbi:MAG: hypothetical protein ACLR9T_07400 [Thomasclavelia sp.]|uniref:hypothetical protein n=1 Tax=Thomasclavelia sp. TaxID=3025757 RepID=UPI0039A0B541
MTMKRKIIIGFVLIGVLATGCNNGNGTNQPNNNSYNKPNEQTPPLEKGDRPGNSSNQTKPSKDQSWDYASGFSIKDLESALRHTGAITTTGEAYDVTGTNMTEATRYGNIVIGTYNWDFVDEALELYQNGSMELKGKKVKVVNMIGNFLLIVLDGEISQESIAAFSAVGGL